MADPDHDRAELLRSHLGTWSHLDVRAPGAPPALTDSVMQAAFVEAPVGVAVIGADLTYLIANRAFCDLVGRTASEVVGASLLDPVHPDDHALIRAPERWLDAGGAGSFEIDHRTLLPDGEVRWLRFRVSVDGVQEGRPTRWVVVAIDVTDQHATAAALVAKEAMLTEVRERYQMSFDHAPIGQALVAPDGTWLAANPALCRLLGYEAAQMLRMTFADITHPDDLAADRALIERMVGGLQVGGAAEKRYRRLDGSWVWVSRTASLVRDERGEPLYFITQVQDITERRRQDQDLRALSSELQWSNSTLQETITKALAGEARYRALVDQLPETVVFLLDRDHRITVASGAGPARFGVHESALIGKRPEDLLGAEAAAAIHEMADSAFAGQPVSAELKLTSTGRDELVDVVAIAGDDPDRPDEVLLLARDISDRKERERALVEHSSDLTTVTDRDGFVRYASPSWEAMTGLRLADAIGMQMDDILHPDDLAMVRAKMAWLHDRPGAVTTYVTRLCRPDGSIRHIEVVATNRLDKPAVRGIVKNSRDVSERVEATERLAHQARHDPLTDLPNRTLLLERLTHSLQRSRREGHFCAVLFVDLDHFKQINDTRGHAAGDRVIVGVAERLAQILRPGDTVGRLGGDEFVVIVEDLATPSIVWDLAERLRGRVAEPIDVGGDRLVVSCSVGIAVSASHEPEALIREADIALYRAKERGRNRIELCDEALRARAAGSSDPRWVERSE